MHPKAPDQHVEINLAFQKDAQIMKERGQREIESKIKITSKTEATPQPCLLSILPGHLIQPAATFSRSDAEKGSRSGEGGIKVLALTLTSAQSSPSFLFCCCGRVCHRRCFFLSFKVANQTILQ